MKKSFPNVLAVSLIVGVIVTIAALCILAIEYDEMLQDPLGTLFFLCVFGLVALCLGGLATIVTAIGLSIQKKIGEKRLQQSPPNVDDRIDNPPPI